MKLIICVDSYYGYSFNNRRQATDKGVREHILNELKTHNITMHINPYTERSFKRTGISFEDNPFLLVEKDDSFPESLAQTDEWVFIENADITNYYRFIDEMMVYKWEKTYPTDKKLNLQFVESFVPTRREVFDGSTHEDVTFVHYELKGAVK